MVSMNATPSIRTPRNLSATPTSRRLGGGANETARTERAGCQQRGDCVSGLGLREMKPLGELAPESAEPVELRFGLDPFGDRAQLQCLREPDDRAGERGRLRVSVEADDERAVDLE